MKPTVNFVTLLLAVMWATITVAESLPHQDNKLELETAGEDRNSWPIEARMDQVNNPIGDAGGEAVIRAGHTGITSHVLHKRSPIPKVIHLDGKAPPKPSKKIKKEKKLGKDGKSKELQFSKEYQQGRKPTSMSSALKDVFVAVKQANNKYKS